MNVLSLFDGISCGRVALERAGIKVDKYYASEIEKKPIEISLKNYPDIIQLGDVTKITKDMVDEIDLIIGGSPCQSFSNAGNRQGFDGKSGLFWEFVRLVNEIKPKYFLLENVKMKQERLYWTNIPNVKLPEDKGIYLKDILQDEVEEKYYLNESAIRTINRNFGSKGKIINLEEKSLIEKITYPSRINQKFGEIKSPTLVAAMGLGGGNVPVLVVNQGKEIVKEVDKSHCLMARDYKGFGNQGMSGVLNNYRLRKLTPIECERLQTLPDNYTDCVSNSQRYKAIGNGWTVDVIAHIFKNLNN